MQSYKYFLPSPEDIKAARAYLGWSQDELAKNADIARKTLFNIESRNAKPSQENLEKIQGVFLNKGIAFQPEGGFLANQSLFRILEGEQGIKEFFEDVAKTAEIEGGEFLVSGMAEDYYYDLLNKIGIEKEYNDKMESIDISYRAITSEECKDKLVPPYICTYATYKVLPEELMSASVPFYIYGSKLAIIMQEETTIIVLRNKGLVDAYTRIFNFLWNSEEAITVCTNY